MWTGTTPVGRVAHPRANHPTPNETTATRTRTTFLISISHLLILEQFLFDGRELLLHELQLEANLAVG